MLVELRVENLLLIERAELALEDGLNVITGETGAGKTVLAHALDLLLGGRPRPGIVRPGASEAYVEGVFAPARPLAQDPELAELTDRVPLDGDEIVLARRVSAEGRTRAYIQGRSGSAPDLRALGTRLLAFYGQHEHRRLTLASAQLEILDSFCGRSHLEARDRFESLWSRARALERELESLRRRSGERERDLDLLEFELREIEELAPEPGEDAALEAERDRLASVEGQRSAVLAAVVALDPDVDASSSGEGALALAALAGSELARARGVDDRLDSLGERLEAIAYEGQELTRELRAYEASLHADPARLEQVEERLASLGRLKRKHGGTVAAVVEHAEHCRSERDRLANIDEASAEVAQELERTQAKLTRWASELRSRRRRAASELDRFVREELRELAMEEASFEVALEERSDALEEGELGRFGPRGADAVEFLIATNPGVPAGRLREIASGGELSRVMLALLSVATSVDGPETVVFDEIDAGVGGNTARAVGCKLRDLGDRRQVVCITHLPQVASLARRHFRVVKRSGPQLAQADVEQLDRGELVGELCRMLGAEEGDGAARRHAERLLAAA
jgi:DNA repair protein RecN (Recombination protein N)